MKALYQRGSSNLANWLALLCIGTVASGCAMGDHRPKVAMDSAAGLYDTATIEYKLDAGQLNLPLAVTRVEGQLVSYDQVPSDPRRDTSVGTLKLEYPHPDGRAGYARARLEIVSTASHGGDVAEPAPTSSWNKVARQMNPKRLWASSTAESAGVDEVWECDIPRAQLDLAVTSLNRGGYFDPRQKGSEGVDVEAKIDGKTVQKNWQQVPELNELMLAVRNQGRLIAYTRPAGDRGGERPSSMVAYERYAEQDRLAALAAGNQPGYGPTAGTPPAYQVASQPPGAPPVVPYFPAQQPANSPAMGTMAGNYPAGAGMSQPPANNLAAMPNQSAMPPLPRQDSIPWRAGSRPAPAGVQPAASVQPAAGYPATGYGYAAPAAGPNVAQQPRYPATPY